MVTSVGRFTGCVLAQRVRATCCAQKPPLLLLSLSCVCICVSYVASRVPRPARRRCQPPRQTAPAPSTRRVSPASRLKRWKHSRTRASSRSTAMVRGALLWSHDPACQRAPAAADGRKALAPRSSRIPAYPSRHALGCSQATSARCSRIWSRSRSARPTAKRNCSSGRSCLVRRRSRCACRHD